MPFIIERQKIIIGSVVGLVLVIILIVVAITYVAYRIKSKKQFRVHSLCITILYYIKGGVLIIMMKYQ